MTKFKPSTCFSEIELYPNYTVFYCYGNILILTFATINVLFFTLLLV